MENNKISVLLNEDDIRRMAEIAYSEDTDKGFERIVSIPKITAIIMFFMMIASFGGIFFIDIYMLPNWFKIAAGVMTAVIMLIALFILIRNSRKFKKAKTEGNQKEKESFFQREMQKRSIGFLPRICTFENNGIHSSGRYSDFVIEYDKLQECHEYSDGVFFRYKSGQVFWLPARFFTKSIADSVSSKMRDIFGKNYILHEKILISETPEAVSAEKFILPQSESELTLNYKLKNHRFGWKFLAPIGYLLKNRVGIYFVFFTAFFGFISVIGILSLIDKAGEPFSMGLLFEICTVCFAVSMVVYIFLLFVMSVIVTILKINKAGNDWYKDGITLEFHGEGMIEKVAAGYNFVPWENVASMKDFAGDLVITDKTSRSLIIPKKVTKSKRKEIESIVTKHLPQGVCENNK